MKIFVAYVILGADYEGDKDDSASPEPIRFMAVGRTPTDATKNLKVEWDKYYLHSKTTYIENLWSQVFLHSDRLDPLWEKMVLGDSDTKIVITEKKFGI